MYKRQVYGFGSVRVGVYGCKVFKNIVGSSMGLKETSISIIYLFILLIISLSAFTVYVKNRVKCAVDLDPLSHTSLLEQLKRQKEEFVENAVLKTNADHNCLEDSSTPLMIDSINTMSETSNEYFTVRFRRKHSSFSIDVS